MTSATFADLVGLIPVLAAVYGVVIGVVALVTGWQVLRGRQPRRKRRGAVVPPVGVIGRDNEGAR
ncbi:MAG: hypothetical protein ACRDTE_13005 [Pseudonocardiaceae bacterium]